MNVIFTRTGERRYRVSIDGPDLEPLYMEPAPGFDAKLPHDAAHFIVEDELGIQGGVFGQLAAGGTAKTFRTDSSAKPKKLKRRGETLAKASRPDAVFSEHAVFVAFSAWTKANKPATTIDREDIERICRRFDDFSRRWAALRIGDAITLEWRGDRVHGRRR